eukprot:NODE_213_length_14376_cov_0.499054.p8 type:complete len:204 gc:universal NODE_213_length_14376_cov_0.499054:6895-6284(-)
MEDYKVKIHELQDTDDENMRCCDCKQPMPSWASLDFGIYICLTCSGIHRGMGVHVSFVRSLNLDNWTELQYQRMEMGGNRRFQEFVGKEFFDVVIQDRYYTEIASEYKERLTCKLKGTQFNKSNIVVPKKPVIKPRDMNSFHNQNLSSSNLTDSVNGFVTSVSSQVYNTVSSTFESIQQSPYTQQSVKKLYDWFNSEEEMEKK